MRIRARHPSSSATSREISGEPAPADADWDRRNVVVTASSWAPEPHRTTMALDHLGQRVCCDCMAYRLGKAQPANRGPAERGERNKGDPTGRGRWGSL